MKDLSFEFRNLGPLYQASVQLKDLTIVCGENNTGKTFITNSIYGAMWRLSQAAVPDFFEIRGEDIESLRADRQVVLDLAWYVDQFPMSLARFSESYSENIHNSFAASKRDFENSEIEIAMSNISLEDCQSGKVSQKQGRNSGISYERHQNESSLLVNIHGDAPLYPRGFEHILIGDALSWAILDPIFGAVHISSAERTGAAIFQKELDFKRSKLIEIISDSDQDVDVLRLLRTQVSDYPEAVTSNVDFIRDVSKLSRDDSEIVEEFPELWADFLEIVGGEFRLKGDEIEFRPHNTARGGRNAVKLPLASGSSASRSLLDLSFYIRHKASRGDILIIDEPELNLHPGNQVRFARFLAKLTMAGVRVFLTTHSDYIVREFSILLMLGKVKGENSPSGYESPLLRLDPERVSAYVTSRELVDVGKPRRQRKLTLRELSSSSSSGLSIPHFDKVIEAQNEVYDSLLWGDI